MKRKTKRIFAGVATISIILFLYYAITEFYGNPYILTKMDTIVKNYMSKNYPSLEYSIENIHFESKSNSYYANLKNTGYDKGHTFNITYHPKSNLVYDDYFSDVCNSLYEDYDELIKNKGKEYNEYVLFPDCDSKNFTLGMPYDETFRQIKTTFAYEGNKGEEDFHIYNLDEVKQHIEKMEELLKDVDVNVQNYQIIFMEIPVKDAHNDIILKQIVDNYAKDRQEIVKLNNKK